MKTKPLLGAVMSFVLINCLWISNLSGQILCSDDTPYFYVDLSADADSVYLSPAIQRDGSCCGSMFPDVCIEFTILLANSAVGLEFDIFSGAEPPGALFYQIDCGPTVMVGEEICLQGGQEYTITFCKPGANQNVYSIRSIQAPITADTVTTRIDCSVGLSISGPIDSTVVWRDVTSGDGSYNAYLSCTMGCDSTIFTPDENAPPVIRYEVCGTYVPENCDILPVTVCDTVIVNTLPDVRADISSTPIIFCEDNIQEVSTAINLPEEDVIFEWYDNANFQNGGPPIANGPSFVPTAEGTYWLVATDTTFAACNTDTASVEIIIHPLPEFSFPTTTVICAGASESILLPDGYTYNWTPSESVSQNPGSNIYTLSPDETTNYTLTAIDEFGCDATTNLLLEVIPEFNVNLTTTEITFCEDNILPIEAQIDGPGGNVVIEWYEVSTNTLVATGSTFLPTESGSFQVVATNQDLADCNVDVAEVVVNIQPLPTFELPPALVLCEGDSQEIELQDGFTYNWSPDTGVSPIPGTNRFILNAQTSTNYTVIASDNLGCTFSQDLELEVVPSFGITISPDQYLFCADEVQPIAGQLTGIGGNVSFTWHDASNNQQLFTGQIFLPPNSGEYYLIAHHNDFDACNTDTAYADVFIQPLPEFELPESLQLCHEESVVLELTDGFTYSWSPGDGVNNILGTNQYEVSPTASTTFTVTAEDEFGCSTTENLGVEVFPEFEVEINPGQVVFCEGQVQAIEATLVGDPANVTYRWYDATSNTLNFTGQSFLPPSSGNYYVVATSNSAATCNVDSAFVDVQIQPAPAFDLPDNSSICTGEGITVDLPDGYSYQWAPSNTVAPVIGTNAFNLTPSSTTEYMISAFGPQGCIFNTEMTVDVLPEFGIAIESPLVEFCVNDVMPVTAELNGAGGNVQVQWFDTENSSPLHTGSSFLPPFSGTFTAVATNFDLAACNTDTAMVEVIIHELPEVSLPTTLENCGDATSIISLPAGNTYTWSPSTGVNVISGNNVFEIAPSQSTNYTLITENDASCTSTDALQVDVGPSFEVSTDAEDLTFCENTPESFSAQASGQAGTISYSWYDSIGLDLGQAPLGTSNTFTPLEEGSYAVVATHEDFEVCNTDTAWVNATILEAPQLELPDLLEVCSSAPSILALPTDYSYQWVPDTGVTPLTSPGQFSILPGSDINYTVVASNAVGCAESFGLSVDLISAPIADAGSAGQLNCANNLVQLSATILNNGPSVDFSWQGPPGGIASGSSTLTPAVVVPGWYFFQLMDNATGCASLDSVQVDADFAEPLAILPELVEIDCNDDQALIDGTASSAGTNISYNWSNLDGSPVVGGGTANLIVDQAGFYELVVTNTSNGCSASATTEVIALPPLTGLSYDANQICFGSNDGLINIGIVEGGTPPFAYSLDGSPFVDVTSFTDLSAGTYTVGVQDVNGCQWWENVTVESYEAIELDLGPTIEIATGEIVELSFSTNLENFLIDSLLWAPADYLNCTSCPNPIASPLISTTFDLTVTDIFGCQATDSVYVRLVEEEIVYIPNGFSPNGDDNNDRFLIYTRPGIGQVEYLKIFDRWGNMVFEAYDFPPNEPLYGWDGNFQGEPMNPAVFVYVTKLQLVNGTSVLRKGDVTLVR